MDPGSPEYLVVQTLRAATNTDHEVVRKAEAQLAEWESQKGFFPTLAQICVPAQQCQDPQTPIDGNVRWMAAVYLKNGITKYWRRCSRHELPAEEKAQIRHVLMTNYINETVPQVALQVAVLMGRIARSDCSRDWPELVPFLIKRLQEAAEGSNPEHVAKQQCSLLALHHVIKALASRRMMYEKRVFEELTGNIFGFMQNVWQVYTTHFFHQLEGSQVEAQSSLERALLSLRTLRKLCVYGFAKPHKSPMCMEFVAELFERLKQCLQCRYELMRSHMAETPLIATLEKFILKQIKAIYEFQDMHSKSFARFVPMALEFSFHHVFHEGANLIFSNNAINFSSFAIHCINLMKGIMMCNAYKPLVKNDEDPEVPAIVALSDFFNELRLIFIVSKVIGYYFLLTQSELDSWDEDPEGFAHDDGGGDSWKYSLRSCVETFYLTCFSQYQAQMTQEVIKYIHRAQNTQLAPNAELKDILYKDAIYNAAGLASFHFFTEIDFDAWFSNQLLAELRIETDNFRILRRRIIWLVAEWCNVKLARDLRPLAYEACLHLLRPVEDMSIRLSACRAVSTLISDFEFAPLPFLPYLEPVFNALFMLLREAKECDTKMNILTNMSTLVEKMSDHIEPQADNLISYLPMLWKESEDYNMLRGAIIGTLQQVVKAIRDIPEKMVPFLYSVIYMSTDLNEPSHIYLLEEGLGLWVAVVENSTSISPHLISLCKNLLPIIEQSSENLRTVLILIQVYILLDPHAYLDLYGRAFVEFCCRMFDDIRSEGIILMLKVFETCLKVEPAYGLELIRPALPYIFKQVYENKEFPMLMSMHLMIIARVLLIDQTVVTAVLQELQLPNALETILDVWINKIPLVPELEKRKLFCLAFGSIFANNAILLERFPHMLQSIQEIVVEIMQEEDDDATQGKEGGDKGPKKWIDSLVYVDEDDLTPSNYCALDDFDYKTYHYDRCRQLSLKDPVHRIVLSDYIEYQLNSLRTQMGVDAYENLMAKVYEDVLKKLSQYIQINFTLIGD